MIEVKHFLPVREAILPSRLNPIICVVETSALNDLFISVMFCGKFFMAEFIRMSLNTNTVVFSYEFRLLAFPSSFHNNNITLRIIKILCAN